MSLWLFIFAPFPLSFSHLKRFPVGDGLVRRLHETEEEMSDEVVRSLGLKEEVHENLESGEVDVLQGKEVGRSIDIVTLFHCRTG